MSKPVVSICCITYNQAKYIEKAIESFLMQKTSFNYEIVIQDDCSTDNTNDILCKYEELYPDKIRVIRNTENLGSKIGIAATFLKALKSCSGKYIAVCEGDDYWINEKKLQIQFEYMEKHSDCSLVFHNAIALNLLNNKKYKMMKLTKRYYKFLKKYDVGDLAKLDFIPTASMFFRTSDLNRIPKFFEESIVGDLPLRLLLTSFGYCYYINKVMSVYVRGTGNSATDNFNNDKDKDVENAIVYLEKKQNILRNINIYTEKKYEKDIGVALDRIESDKYMYRKDYKGILKNYKIFKASPRKRMLLILKLNIMGKNNGKK